MATTRCPSTPDNHDWQTPFPTSLNALSVSGDFILLVPQAPFIDLPAANDAARAWCAEVNSVEHSVITAIPSHRPIL
jgi:hypothetical protein